MNRTAILTAMFDGKRERQPRGRHANFVGKKNPASMTRGISDSR
jgi:hypothetical protein